MLFVRFALCNYELQFGYGAMIKLAVSYCGFLNTIIRYCR